MDTHFKWRAVASEAPPEDDFLLFEFDDSIDEEGQPIKVFAYGGFCDEHWQYRNISNGTFIHDVEPIYWTRIPSALDQWRESLVEC